MSIYEKLPPPTSGVKYAKFPNVGDSIAGVIVSADVHAYQDGDPERPRYGIKLDDTGELIYWHVTQSNAYAQIFGLKPEIGDRIRATFSGHYRTANGQGKNFTIHVTPGDDRDVI